MARRDCRDGRARSARAYPARAARAAPAGAVVYWFFTSCGCPTTPPAGAAAAASGAADVTLTRAGAVPGGYTAKLFPGGSDAVAAVSPAWINWQKVGW